MYSQHDLYKLLRISSFILLFYLGCAASPAQTLPDNLNAITLKLDRLPAQPRIISYQNSLKINTQGGHIQGIQMTNHKGKAYVIVTGSSNSISYYAVLKSGDKNEVISVNKILDLPYKHAGGFQINDGFMAIGIEDNNLKTTSKVYVYAFEDPEAPPKAPLKVIERSGPAKRATAGCVGIVKVGEEVLLVVGNWDAVHLDLYRMPASRIRTENSTFELFQTIDSRTVDRSGWIDEQWLSYQNMNLFRDADENIYLSAFASAGDTEVLDLFSLERSSGSELRMKKIYSRDFVSSGVTRFRWGAGMYIDGNGMFHILSSCENVGKECQVAVYE